MKIFLNHLMGLLMLAVGTFTAHAAATTTGFPGFTMDFVDIAGGATADNTGYGAVANDYRMGKHEVSRAMITTYNTANPGLNISMADMTNYGGNGANRPATGVSWNEAAHFVNWLNTSGGHPAAYKFTSGGTDDNIVLWSVGDAGFDPSNPFRNSDAYYFLPSEDEWYRAAFYDPSASGGTGGYWDYATGSDVPPTSVASGTAPGSAVIGFAPAGPADIDNAGGLSPFGTMAQGGNVFEWTESNFGSPYFDPDGARSRRPGAWLTYPPATTSSEFRSAGRAGGGNDDLGFRVASVPEPSPMWLVQAALFALVMRRRRSLAPLSRRHLGG